MFANSRFLESNDLAMGFAIVDLETGANTGNWVSLAEYAGVLVVFAKSVGTSGDDPVLTLLQASDIAGTGSKALNFTSVYKKVGATLVNAVKQFTAVTQASANTFTLTGGAVDQAVIAVDIHREELDIANGFCCVKASAGDTGSNAQLGGELYILYGANNMRSIPLTALETEATDST